MQGLELKDLALRWSSCTRIWALTKKGFCNSLSHTTFITKIIDVQCLQKELWDMEQTGQERSSHLTLTTTEITADKLSWITTEIKPFSSRFNNHSWSCQIHLCQEYSLYKKKSHVQTNYLRAWNWWVNKLSHMHDRWTNSPTPQPDP
jgi:hypothetical protein